MGLSTRTSGIPTLGTARLTMCADLVRLGVLCAAAIFLAMGEGSAALKALLVLPVALAARLVRVHPVLDLTLALALATEAIGSGAAGYDAIAGGDTSAHLVLPLLSGPVLYVGLVRLGAVPNHAARPDTLGLLGAAIVTSAAVLALGAAWELVEWAADGMLDTNYSQGYDDTLGDLLNDALAATGSGALVALWLRGSAGRPALALAIPRAGGARESREDARAG